MMVLIVDDDSDDQEIFCEAIKGIDPTIECIIANDGIEAVEYLNRNSVLPDFVFLDINMPRMNGRECLTLIKANCRFAEITVVMCGTSESPSEVNTFKNMGALFLQKPSTMVDLLISVMGILKSKPGI